MSNNNRTNKDSAVDFLQQVVAGSIDEAYEAYVDMEGKHHNVYFPATFSILKSAMMDDQKIHPHKHLVINNVICDNDLVAVHSHLVFSEDQPGMSVVHIFRFKDGKIVEMWDVGQEIPKDLPNSDGAF